MIRTNKEYMKIRLTRMVEEEWARALELFPEFAKKTVPYTLKWRSVGRAAGSCKMIGTTTVFLQGKKPFDKIELVFHWQMLADNPANARQTVVHEICHAVANVIEEKGCHHGTAWKRAMREMGVPAKIYHAMNTADYRKKVTKYQWQCQGCGHIYNISGAQHNRIQSGRSGAHCSLCGGLELIYLGSKKI